MTSRALPSWAEEIRSTYLRGEAAVFILHGNVFDHILHEGELVALPEFLVNVLLAKKDVICHYNTSLGVQFRKKEQTVNNLEDLIGVRDNEKVLGSLEKMLRTTDGVALILDYAESIAPAGDPSFLTEADRRAVVTLHRWSLDRVFENADNVVILVTEQLSDLSPKIVSNPRISTVQIPLPTADDRQAIVRLLEPEATPREVERIASHSAGLKNVQIRGILVPGEDSDEDYADRYDFIRGIVDDSKIAKKLARMSSGWTHEQIRQHLEKEGYDVSRYETDDNRYEEVLALLERRKREILEKECFGLVEFVQPDHDFSAVGGMDEIKKELMAIAHNIRQGNTKRAPMGLLFTGPMGTGKTFVAEAFARSSGLTAIKLKNFRSKWVGATEGNLEKILGVVQAIGNVLVIIDEGDRAFGSSGEGDGGTSSRVIARIKEFMSDTTNRGRVLFVLMTNRPDKLDIDIKRAGRLDKKIPFFYAQEAEDLEPILMAQLRRHHVTHDIEFPRDRSVSERMVGYSNADLEAIVLAAYHLGEKAGEKVTAHHLAKAIDDYLPSRDETMLEYMEMLAVFESSSRAMLPKKYADMSPAQLQDRLRTLKTMVR
ncbi:MAG: ATP-binding protein [Deltaproteobacteria bacterium]|jgi:transitional endoplasmic reticulum ATPase